MTAHLIELVKQELEEQHAPAAEIAKWQENFDKATTTDELVLLEQNIAATYGPDFDKHKRIEAFIRASKMDYLKGIEPIKEPEPPEELVAAVAEGLKGKSAGILVKCDSRMEYSELTKCLQMLCIAKLNLGISILEPYRMRLPFVITRPDEVQCQITSMMLAHKVTLPLITVYNKEEETLYRYIGEPAPRDKYFQRLASFSADFYLYQARENNRLIYLFSFEELKFGVCRIAGMRLTTSDFIKVGEGAKISAEKVYYFVHSQKPEIIALTDTEFTERTKSLTMDSLSEKVFGAYHHPPWYEKLILAWMFSGKFSGYPLHIAVLSPAGTGKTFMMEGIASLTGERLASGSNSTLKGLVPSFGAGIKNDGYLNSCKRFAFIDEFFGMLRRTVRNSDATEADAGTAMMLEMLEHKEREIQSGYGAMKIQPRMKAFLVANSRAYSGLQSMVEVSEHINYAFLSRWLWYCLTPDHREFISKNKGKLATIDRTKNMPAYDTRFIELLDYLMERVVEVDTAKAIEIQKAFQGEIPAELAERIYEPRAMHHILCLVDGYAKLNSIIEHRPQLAATDADYEEVRAVFGAMVMSWDSNIDLYTLPERQRILYLKESLRQTYDKVEKNPGMGTPDMKNFFGDEVWKKLNKLKELGVVKSVTDVDGITQLWYPWHMR